MSFTSYKANYNFITHEYNEEEPREELQTLPFNGAVWKGYMLELVYGTVPEKGVLVSIEGAKICVSLIAIVPGKDDQLPFVIFNHYGCYEPYFRNSDLSEDEIMAVWLDCETTAYGNLVVPLLDKTLLLARHRNVKATLIVGLGSQQGHGSFLEHYLCNQVKQYHTDYINLIIHRSHQSTPHREPYNGLSHTVINRNGDVKMLFAVANFGIEEGHSQYYKISRNSAILFNGHKLDGACHPFMVAPDETDGRSLICPAMKFMCELQLFLHMNMDDVKDQDETRKWFVSVLYQNAINNHDTKLKEQYINAMRVYLKWYEQGEAFKEARPAPKPARSI